MSRAPADRKPDWPAVTYEALAEPSCLMRVLAAMGFSDHLGVIPRSAVPFWPPAYARGPSARRHGFAALNRSLRDADVHVLHDPAAQFLVCAHDGEWRTHSGAQRGDDLISLGALRWACRYGQAAARIARVIGLREIPRRGHA